MYLILASMRVPVFTGRDTAICISGVLRSRYRQEYGEHADHMAQFLMTSHVDKVASLLGEDT